jgi:phosphopantetheine adenylyltransferase
MTATAAMTVVPGVDALTSAHGRLFVVVGVFDGLHRGHAYLLEHLVREARARDARPAVITFDHHPDEVIQGTAPPLLCDPEERLERLAAAGVDVTIVQTFDVALRMTPFDDFVRRVAERVDLAGFLMTRESAFGHDRGGTPETVAALGRELGYDVVVVPPMELGGRPVRSADIRAAIADGDLGRAADLLGQPYAVVGTVSGPGDAGDRPDVASDGGASQRGTPVGTSLALDFPMPVALPPPARYAARLAAAAGAPRPRAGWAVVRPDGALDVEASGFDRAIGDRVRVVFLEERTDEARVEDEA